MRSATTTLLVVGAVILAAGTIAVICAFYAPTFPATAAALKRRCASCVDAYRRLEARLFQSHAHVEVASPPSADDSVPGAWHQFLATMKHSEPEPDVEMEVFRDRSKADIDEDRSPGTTALHSKHEADIDETFGGPVKVGNTMVNLPPKPPPHTRARTRDASSRDAASESPSSADKQHDSYTAASLRTPPTRDRTSARRTAPESPAASTKAPPLELIQGHTDPGRTELALRTPGGSRV